MISLAILFPAAIFDGIANQTWPIFPMPGDAGVPEHAQKEKPHQVGLFALCQVAAAAGKCSFSVDAIAFFADSSLC
ncbi:MAG: hypothetical protein J7639_34000, partial [Paenibacillaceae bacterium]|nr:hypothetical protein [Paenibacillaceae bacterium]